MNKLFCTWEKKTISIPEKISIIKSLIILVFTFLAIVCLVPERYVSERNKKRKVSNLYEMVSPIK